MNGGNDKFRMCVNLLVLNYLDFNDNSLFLKWQTFGFWTSDAIGVFIDSHGRVHISDGLESGPVADEIIKDILIVKFRMAFEWISRYRFIYQSNEIFKPIWDKSNAGPIYSNA